MGVHESGRGRVHVFADEGRRFPYAELLKDFKGVLVTDFLRRLRFSLGCPQQKCSIHLMRDMNQELLNCPYDDELMPVDNRTFW